MRIFSCILCRMIFTTSNFLSEMNKQSECRISIEKADKVLWNNKSAYDVFHKAVVTRLITRLDYASYIF